MQTKYNRRTIKQNFFVIDISLGIHIIYVKYELIQ